MLPLLLAACEADPAPCAEGLVRDDAAIAFADALDLTMPVLYDEGGVVHAGYVTLSEVPSAAYPEEWIVGTDGTIVDHAALYDYRAVIDVIESELGGR